MERLLRLLRWKERTPAQLQQRNDYKELEWAKEIRPLKLGKALTEVIPAFDAQCIKISNSIEPKLLRMVCDCISSMGPDDIYAFTSFSVMPLEFDKEHWGPVSEAIAEAVNNGGLFLYVWPSEKAVKEYTKDFGYWSEHKICEPKDFYETVRLFRENVRDYLKKEGKSISDDKIAERTPQVFCDKCPFWAPGFATGMFRTLDYQGDVIRRMTVRVPTNSFGVLYICEDRRNLFEWRFEQVLRWAVRNPSTEETFLSDKEVRNLAKVRDLLDKEFLAGERRPKGVAPAPG